MKRIAIAGAVILLLLITATVYYQFKQTRVGVQGIITKKSIAAVEFYKLYSQNEDIANKQFLDKVIEVSGTVSTVQTGNNNLMILLNADDLIGGINCSMQAENDKADLQSLKGKQVVIKGRCTGYLIDVNLVDCIIIKPTIN